LLLKGAADREKRILGTTSRTWMKELACIRRDTILSWRDSRSFSLEVFDFKRGL
jgi:hypothetical protein